MTSASLVSFGSIWSRETVSVTNIKPCSTGPKGGERLKPLRWTQGTLKISDLASELELCAVLINEPDFIRRYLLPLSNYNLRRMLDMLLSAFQSYYFFFDRFNNDRYLPTKATLRKRFLISHLLKNTEYYDPSSRTDQEQFIINLFENENPSSDYNQTIRIRLLQVLMFFGRNISLRRYLNHLESIFAYERYDILRGLRVFLEKDLIALKDVTSPTFDTSVLHEGLKEEHFANDHLELALTYSGRLHYDLLFILEYVEIMKLSTYVDNSVYLEIHSDESQRTFERRARSTRRFLEYLSRQEELEISRFVKNRTQFDLQVKRLIPELQVKISKALQEVSEFPEHRSS